MEWPLEFEIVAECSVTRARTAKLKLPHAIVEEKNFANENFFIPNRSFDYDYDYLFFITITISERILKK